MFEGSSYSGNIDWNDIVKKEARGINNEDLGYVQEVTKDYVLVEKGVINKERFYIPRDLAVGYNGTILIFNISAEQAKKKFLRSSLPVFLPSHLAGKDSTITDDLTIVPIMAERLDVTKKKGTQEAKITKESITEIKTNEVQLAHDELYIETRPISYKSEQKTSNNKNQQQEGKPSSLSDIPKQEEVATLYIRAEVPEVSKHPFLREEIVVKKKTVTETKRISEQLRSEQLNVEGAIEQEKEEENKNSLAE
jgi:uncharacterized protein (TIGR02271 family)